MHPWDWQMPSEEEQRLTVEMRRQEHLQMLLEAAEGKESAWNTLPFQFREEAFDEAWEFLTTLMNECAIDHRYKLQSAIADCSNLAKFVGAGRLHTKARMVKAALESLNS